MNPEPARRQVGAAEDPGMQLLIKMADANRDYKLLNAGHRFSGAVAMYAAMTGRSRQEVREEANKRSDESK